MQRQRCYSKLEHFIPIFRNLFRRYSWSTIKGSVLSWSGIRVGRIQYTLRWWIFISDETWQVLRGAGSECEVLSGRSVKTFHCTFMHLVSTLVPKIEVILASWRSCWVIKPTSDSVSGTVRLLVVLRQSSSASISYATLGISNNMVYLETRFKEKKLYSWEIKQCSMYRHLYWELVHLNMYIALGP